MANQGERERQNKRQFDALAASYDRLGFLAQTAQYVAQGLRPPPGAALLDVMTGTGAVALTLAAGLDPQARVVGADLSESMLDVARTKGAGHQNVSWVQADATALPFPDETFDVVVCASGLFFVPDMGAALREWRRVLRVGGTVVFSSFGRGLMGELPALWRESLATYGVQPGFPPLGRIPNLEAARDLLVQAGFNGVEVSLTELPYRLAQPQERWADIVAGLEGLPLGDFTPGQQAELKEEHFSRLQGLNWPVVVPLPVIVASGLKN